MANIKSQIKRNKTNEKRRIRNKGVRSRMHTMEKAAVEAAGTDSADETLRNAISAIDKAAQRNVIHKNAAARRKSRLIKKTAAS